MVVRVGSEDVVIERVDVSAYRVPTDFPESDGTYEWTATTLILVEARAGGKTGLGYSYADTATARLVRDLLAEVIRGRDAMAVPGSWSAMIAAVRNLGCSGIAAMAISAADAALWDLKARLVDLPLVTLLGAVHDAAPVYGSGGFTSYPIDRLQEQLGGWAAAGIPRVKMKIGRQPADDVRRVRAAREAIGTATELFVDANGAYSRKQALEQAERIAESRVSWFEEPVSSDDLEGLRLLRDRAPAGMEIAAGEYGYHLCYFRRMLEAGAVDVLQADATRCCGVSGFLKVGALCEARGLPLSAHCAPSLHVHAACALSNFRHLEYFHDHERIEHWLFDGALTPQAGVLRPDLARSGLGLEFKRQDAQRYAL
jgi:L-alanine-DL-glutamate epimerase-like enolase superfamily enzyme